MFNKPYKQISIVLVTTLTCFPTGNATEPVPFYLRNKDEPLPAQTSIVDRPILYRPGKILYADWIIKRAKRVSSDLDQCYVELERFNPEKSEKEKLNWSWTLVKISKKKEYLQFLSNKFYIVVGETLSQSGFNFNHLPEPRIESLASNNKEVRALANNKDAAVSEREKKNQKLSENILVHEHEDLAEGITISNQKITLTDGASENNLITTPSPTPTSAPTPIPVSTDAVASGQVRAEEKTSGKNLFYKILDWLHSIRSSENKAKEDKPNNSDQLKVESTQIVTAATDPSPSPTSSPTPLVEASKTAVIQEENTIFEENKEQSAPDSSSSIEKITPLLAEEKKIASNSKKKKVKNKIKRIEPKNKVSCHEENHADPSSENEKSENSKPKLTETKDQEKIGSPNKEELILEENLIKTAPPTPSSEPVQKENNALISNEIPPTAPLPPIDGLEVKSAQEPKQENSEPKKEEITSKIIEKEVDSNTTTVETVTLNSEKVPAPEKTEAKEAVGSLTEQEKPKPSEKEENKTQSRSLLEKEKDSLNKLIDNIVNAPKEKKLTFPQLETKKTDSVSREEPFVQKNVEVKEEKKEQISSEKSPEQKEQDKSIKNKEESALQQDETSNEKEQLEKDLENRMAESKEEKENSVASEESNKKGKSRLENPQKSSNVIFEEGEIQEANGPSY